MTKYLIALDCSSVESVEAVSWCAYWNGVLTLEQQDKAAATRFSEASAAAAVIEACRGTLGKTFVNAHVVEVNE